MSRLRIEYTSAFRRDIKRLDRKHVDDKPLRAVINLIAANTPQALDELRRRHRMHTLAGNWSGSNECHIANAGDWLLIWSSNDKIALMERTGTHDELFR
ncbi:type II toxin-antitoxin system YafQ family toxin [Olsenella uli]|uniref:type II toxin-antitoxin system RelE/ParE family toxin n=1 Tax=Olsenella uli TaxID=133926 RepID=UPI0028D28B5E|nr:type II toxin-antitoxin system YafQ family toxin [Olsenella uli]